LKIQLIHSPNDFKYENLKTGYDSYPPPVGLSIIASYLKRHININEVKIEIFDGNVSSFQTIKENLNGDFIGFSDWFINHENSVALAKFAKYNNPKAIIIFGGPNASNLGKKILQNHNEIDYVVYGDGEEAMLNIIQNTNELINTWHRNEDTILFSVKKNVPIEDTVPFDFIDIVETDIQKYYNCVDNTGLTPVPISSIRGCLKALIHKPCSYCSIPRFSKINIMNPVTAWKQIDFMYAKYGINYFFETGDNFLIDGFHKKMLDCKPNKINVKFRIYADFDSLTYSDIDILKKLGVSEIYIGLESISHDVIQKAYRSSDKKHITQIVSYLDKKGIDVYLPFLFGLPGESKISINENFSFAKELLSNNSNIQRILFSLAIPLVGTNWFYKLEHNENVIEDYYYFTGKNLRTDDMINYELLFLLSLKHYTTVYFLDIYHIINQSLSNKLKNRIANFGSLEKYMLDMDKQINKKQELSIV
jgi:radical SAM superfamily enzyme YgiQ (UPF0313 family)